MATGAQELADEELVRLFQASGAMADLDVLFGRHMKRIRQLIFPIVLHAGDADDLTQEVFLRAARALPDFRREARFSTWLNRIAINTSLTFLRGQRRAPRQEELQPDDHAATQAGPHDATAHGELDAAIQSALTRLPPELRAAITLTAIHGLRPAEAADAAGCLTATLYWRVHQARKLLRDDLKEYLP